MRKRIVAGNWKMNLLPSDAIKLYNEIVERSSSLKDAEIMVFPPSLYLTELLRLKRPVSVGAQNFHPEEKGAFTGEISVSQIASVGVKYALIGHSERRMYFNEKEDFLKNKVDAALLHQITPVFCCGEPLEVREKNDQTSYVRKQLQDSLFHLSPEDIKKCIIAYEPVWAIGTGKTASSQQAEEMHAAIRSWLKEVYTAEIADSISILYGGSCNASNAAELFACPNVDGGLIGGASLDAETFLTIAESF
jgi:triosephosphate isomerase (TIM)